jgi:hypothetical protein
MTALLGEAEWEAQRARRMQERIAQGLPPELEDAAYLHRVGETVADHDARNGVARQRKRRRG